MYQPSQPTIDTPKDVGGIARWTAAFVGWVLGELRKVATALTAARTEVVYKPLYEDPPRRRACMVVYFAASAPSASSGEGLYVRNMDDTAWSKL